MISMAIDSNAIIKFIIESIEKINNSIDNCDKQQALLLQNDILTQCNEFDLNISIDNTYTDIFDGLKELKLRLGLELINILVNIDINININKNINKKYKKNDEDDNDKFKKLIIKTKQNLNNIENIELKEKSLEMVNELEEINNYEKDNENKEGIFKKLINFLQEHSDLIIDFLELIILILNKFFIK